MPANLPFVPKLIRQFLAWINGMRRTKAEMELDEATAKLDHHIHILGEDQKAGVMAMTAEEANFLALLTRLVGNDKPLKVLDIGTFTGRSAGAIARAMPHGGQVITCDLDDPSINPHFAEHMALAQKYWKADRVSERIQVRAGRAEETMDDLIAKGEQNTFDMVIIDAKKEDYDQYYEKALTLLRPGGLVVLDNMLLSGAAADSAVWHKEPGAKALGYLDVKIAKDERVDPVLLGFGDGVMVVQKRDPEKYRKMIMQQGAAAHAK